MTNGRASVNTTPIVALDVPTASAAMALVGELGDACRFYKVGNELFTAAGPSVVAAIREHGCEVFLDLKFHDIPNTVAGGVRNAAKLGASLVTVHASGGAAMLRAAVGRRARCGWRLSRSRGHGADVAERRGGGATRGGEMPRSTWRPRCSGSRMWRATAGVDGVVCGGSEARAVSRALRRSLVDSRTGRARLPAAMRRTRRESSTPREAAAAGARYVVVGRMVTGAADRRQAMQAVSLELSSRSHGRRWERTGAGEYPGRVRLASPLDRSYGPVYC